LLLLLSHLHFDEGERRLSLESLLVTEALLLSVPLGALEPHPVDQDALALRDPGCLGLRDLCNVLEGRHRELVAQVANVQCVTARVLLQVRRQEQSRIVEGRDLEGR